jgi:hypothetical protein
VTAVGIVAVCKKSSATVRHAKQFRGSLAAVAGLAAVPVVVLAARSAVTPSGAMRIVVRVGNGRSEMASPVVRKMSAVSAVATHCVVSAAGTA